MLTEKEVHRLSLLLNKAGLTCSDNLQEVVYAYTTYALVQGGIKDFPLSWEGVPQGLKNLEVVVTKHTSSYQVEAKDLISPTTTTREEPKFKSREERRMHERMSRGDNNNMNLPKRVN
jgi:hypothetical protein